MLVPAAVAVAALAAVGIASAYFSSTGPAATTFATATLDAPTITAATPGAGEVSLSWSTVSVPTGLPGSVTYYVTRDGGVPTGCPAAGAQTAVTSCTDTGLSAGSHTYTVTAVWHTWTATSTSANVTLASGAATQLVFTTQPVAGVPVGATWPTSPVVTVEDASGNVVTADTGSVTLSITAGPDAGSLSCTNSGFPTVTAVAGVASFANCEITGAAAAGTYTLAATRTGLTSTGDSSDVVIAVGAADKLVFTTQPAGAVTEGATFSMSPVVEVEDSAGNALTGDTGNVTLQVASGPMGGVLSCSNPGFPTIAAVDGVATFTDCQITGTSGAGTYTLVATRAGVTPTPASSSVVIDVGAASRLAFSTQPVGNVAEHTVFSTSPAVAVEDAYGNLVPSDTGEVTLAISTGPAAGSLSCASATVAAVAGIASFAGCQISGAVAAGTYTLVATRAGLTSTGSSSSVVITAGAASALVFTTQPAGSISEGVAFTTSPVVALHDSDGNLVTADVGVVTLAIASGPAAGVLSCSSGTTVAALAGVASFAGCQITGTAAAGTYTLVATRTGLTSTSASNSVAVTAGAANKLVFTTQPVGGVAEGANFPTPPVVTVEDFYGNTATSDTGNVVLAIASGPPAGSLSCTATTIAAVAGVASFAGCQITGTAAAGTYTLSATRAGLTPTGSSSNVVITVGVANKLAFTTQPIGGVAEGVALGTQPVVKVQDAYGNAVTTDSGSVTLAIASGPAAGALSCTATTVTAVAGTATFANCKVTGTAAAGTYTLAATRAGLATGTSSSVVITAGAATKLAFTTQPAGGVAEGVAFATAPVVTVQDSYGNAVTTDTGNITLAKSTGPAAGSLSCAAMTVAAVAGAATFAGCQISGAAAAGTYTLSATRAGLTTGTSGNVVITPGAASVLAFTTQPVGGVAEATSFATSPVVKVQDSYGNTVTTDTGTVTLAIASGPAAGSITCTNSGFPSPAAVAGVVTFTSCKINGTAAAGTYTLVATRAGLTSTGSSNTVVIVVGVAKKLVFTTQPVGGVSEGVAFATQPVVTVQDASGNTVTTDTGSVALAKSTGPAAGSLSCTATTVTAVAGVATFAGCQVTGTAAAGTYTLSATRTGLTSGTSSNVVIAAGAATKLAFTTQPVGNVAESTNFTTSPVVKVQDSYGNTVTTDTGTITLAIASGSGAGVLTCTNSGFPTVTAVSGSVTFTSCKITGTAAAGTYTLVATRAGLTSTGSSNNVVINVGTANKLVFTTQPVVGVSEGLPFGTQPVVTVQDSSGNTVTTDAGNVTLTKASGPAAGVLSCTATTVSAVAGVATFANCQITGAAAAGTYTLSATRAGLTTGTSGNVTIAVGAASTLVFTTQPVGGVGEGVNFATQPVAKVEDAYANVVTTDTGNVTLAIATGPAAGVLSCTASTVAAVAGVATFAGCKITGTAAAGTYTLSVTRAGLTPGTSGNVVITVGAANKLAFTTQPVGGVAVGTVLPTQPVVAVQDSFGNTVTTDAGNVTLAKASGPAAGSLSCTATTVAAVAGVATFAGCKITGASAGGVYTVTATRAGLTATGPSSGFVVADNTAPAISSITLANHGTAGTADAGDTATVRFGEPMDTASFCSAWTSDSATQTITGATLTLSYSEATTGDTLTVSAAPACTFSLDAFGAGANYLTSDSVTFTSSTVTYDPSAMTLTLTLGAPSSMATLKTGVVAGKPSFTPSNGDVSILGLPLSTNTVTSAIVSGW
jgi:hypothetical protein